MATMAAVAHTIPTPVASQLRVGSETSRATLQRSSSSASAAPRITRTARAGAVPRPVVMSTVAPPEQKTGKKEWNDKRAYLVKRVQSVTPAEAARLVKDSGHVIVDVRTQAEHNEVHPFGSLGAEFYRLIKEWTPYHVLRRAAFAFFGVFNGTEENPDFLKVVEAAVPDKDTPIIVACMPGGTLKPTRNFPYGKESRSLNAAFVLSKNGYTSIKHIEGGIYEYLKADLPVEFVE